MSYSIRSGRQHEILVAISLIEKARYLAEASQQLSYDVLRELLPVSTQPQRPDVGPPRLRRGKPLSDGP